MTTSGAAIPFRRAAIRGPATRLRGRFTRIAVLISLMTCFYVVGATTNQRHYTGPRSDHFDGSVFFNPDGESGTGGARTRPLWITAAHWIEGRDDGVRWPRSVPVSPSVPARRIDGDAMVVTWIGHASTLVQTQGLNILIDPIFEERPFMVFGHRRVREPGVRLEDLPPIDLVLVSHDHYDHLEMSTLRFLQQRDHPMIVTALGNDDIMAAGGVAAIARDWGDRVNVRPGIDVVLTRAHHWSRRLLGATDRALWTGFRVTLPGGDLYYSGDTGPGDMKWALEARGSAPIRLALLPIAPYKVDTAPSGNHIDPEEAVIAFQQLDAAYALGVHWGTFEIGPEPIDGAPRRLADALVSRGIDGSRFRTMEPGRSWIVPRSAPQS